MGIHDGDIRNRNQTTIKIIMTVRNANMVLNNYTYDMWVQLVESNLASHSS